MNNAVQPNYPEDALLPGTELKGYTIKKVLGRGSFGITYLAEETKLERPVAIKEYLPEMAAVRENRSVVRARSEDHKQLFTYGLDSFLEEAKTLVKFNNPNIVRVLTYFSSFGTAYLVMEYEVGMDLNQYLKENPKPGENALISIFSPINRGLNAVHQSGYIHRDIKADNIYIRKDRSPVLLDFGAARNVISSEVDQLTRILTVGYAPYEQDNPTWADQGPWTDIYALGATLYYCVTGRRPVSSTERAGAIISQQKDPLESAVSLSPPGYSLNFLSAIDKALRFKPQDRPQSTEEWDTMLTSPDQQATIIATSLHDSSQQPEGKKEAKRNDPPEAVVSASEKPASAKSRATMWTAGLLSVAIAAGAATFLYSPDEKKEDSNLAQGRIKSGSESDLPESSDPGGSDASPDQQIIPNRPNAVIAADPEPDRNITQNQKHTDEAEIIAKIEPEPEQSKPDSSVSDELEQSKSLVLSTMVLAKTACWHFARGQKIIELIEKIKALPETSDRTRFLVDQNRKLAESQSGFETNFSQYRQSVQKLQSFDSENIKLALDDFFSLPQYINDQTYRELGKTLIKHTQNTETEPGNWKDDLISISNSSAFSES